MNSVQQDIIERAIAEVQYFCSPDAQDRTRQSIADIGKQIELKEQAVAKLEAERADLVDAAKLCAGKAPALALAFERLAGILNEEIERQKPHGLEKKLREAEHRLREMQSIAHALTSEDIGALIAD